VSWLCVVGVDIATYYVVLLIWVCGSDGGYGCVVVCDVLSGVWLCILVLVWV